MEVEWEEPVDWSWIIGSCLYIVETMFATGCTFMEKVGSAVIAPWHRVNTVGRGLTLQCIAVTDPAMESGLWLSYVLHYIPRQWKLTDVPVVLVHFLRTWGQCSYHTTGSTTYYVPYRHRYYDTLVSVRRKTCGVWGAVGWRVKMLGCLHLALQYAMAYPFPSKFRRPYMNESLSL